MIRTVLAALLWPGLALAGALDHSCETARFVGPTDRYAHCVLGDCLEWSGLEVTVTVPARLGAQATVPLTVGLSLPETRVFEDLAPRCAPMGPNGEIWVIVVESAQGAGAQLAAYTLDQDAQGLRLIKIAETPHIGRQNRWLAPAGIADFDGDGQLDVAFVDRPHLARTLRVVTPRNGRFVQIAAAPGHSNHRIGEDFISGGVRDCGTGPEVITANASWSQVLATALDGQTLISRPLGPFTGPESLKAARTCP
ncbi:MAG: VCBS repeat-containing protein [Pseudomonadota bacterium]